MTPLLKTSPFPLSFPTSHVSCPFHYTTSKELNSIARKNGSHKSLTASLFKIFDTRLITYLVAKFLQNFIILGEFVILVIDLISIFDHYKSSV